MHNVEPITYTKGMFDPYKAKQNPDDWDGFSEMMWGLGFEMDAGKSYYDFLEKCDLKLKETESERQKKRNRLYVLEHADRQIVGNYLFSYWRYLTHWAIGGYSTYDIDFLFRVVEILEKTYENDAK